MTTKYEKWLTPEDVSEILQICRASAYNLIKKVEESGGNVWRPSKRMTRVEPESLFAYLEKK